MFNVRLSVNGVESVICVSAMFGGQAVALAVSTMRANCGDDADIAIVSVESID